MKLMLCFKFSLTLSSSSASLFHRTRVYDDFSCNLGIYGKCPWIFSCRKSIQNAVFDENLETTSEQ